MNKITVEWIPTPVVMISKEHYDIFKRIAEENDVPLKDVVTDVIDRGLKSQKYRKYATKSSPK